MGAMHIISPPHTPLTHTFTPTFTLPRTQRTSSTLPWSESTRRAAATRAMAA